MELREKIIEAASECWSEDGTDFYTGMLADKILELPEIDPTPTRQRILIALGGLRDGMSPAQVRTVQWFADQLA